MKASMLLDIVSGLLASYGNGEIVFADNSIPNAIVARGIDGQICYSIERDFSVAVNLGLSNVDLTGVTVRHLFSVPKPTASKGETL